MQKAKIQASTINLYSRLNEFFSSKGFDVIIKESLQPKDEIEISFRIPYEFREKNNNGPDEVLLYGGIRIKSGNLNINIESEFFNDELEKGLELSRMESYLVGTIKENAESKSKSNIGYSEIDEAIDSFKKNNAGDWRDDEGIKSILISFCEQINKYKKQEEDLVNELADFLSK